MLIALIDTPPLTARRPHGGQRGATAPSSPSGLLASIARARVGGSRSSWAGDADTSNAAAASVASTKAMTGRIATEDRRGQDRVRRVP